MDKSNYDTSHYNIVTSGGISNILVGLTMFSIFLAIFYFTYASKIEKDILEIQIKNLIDNLTADLKNVDSSSSNTDNLKKIIDSINPDLSSEDSRVDESNKAVINKALVSFSIFAVITIIIVSILFYTSGTHIKDIIVMNAILLLFVALTEVFFLNMIAKSYRSLDPNKIKLNIIKKLQSFSK